MIEAGIYPNSAIPAIVTRLRPLRAAQAVVRPARGACVLMSEDAPLSVPEKDPVLWSGNGLGMANRASEPAVPPSEQVTVVTVLPELNLGDVLQVVVS